MAEKKSSSVIKNDGTLAIMRVIGSIIISMLAVGITSYILPGVQVDSLSSLLLAAVFLGIANGVIRPILLLLTLPITIVTLGLFTLVINAALVLLVSQVVPGFEVAGFLWALLFSLVLSLVNTLLGIFKN